MTNKIDKLISRITALIRVLVRHDHDIIIRTCIDKYYYIQKCEELKLLKEVSWENDLVLEHYRVVFLQWRRDVRWLNTHLVRLMKENARQNEF